jgi:hypothetical protein
MSNDNELYKCLLKHVKTIYGHIDQESASQSSAGKEALEAIKWFVFEPKSQPAEKKAPRSEQERQMIEQWTAKYRELFGNGVIFANAIQKAIQDWDTYKIIPKSLEPAKEDGK